MDEAAIRSRAEELTGRSAPARLEIFTDTTEFMGIWRDHVLRLGGRTFLVLGDMREGRFGVDDQPKFWVKKALELETGATRILKLVFHEEFQIRIGLLRIRCRRDPDKESAFLDHVRGDARYMQGETVVDDHGNAVRVIDFIRGKNLYDHLTDLPLDHKTYCRTALPGVLRRVVSATQAIADVHASGLHHGDIRNDHLIIDEDDGTYRWIDFDLCQDVSDFDVWSLGNVLHYAIGKGERTFHALAEARERGDEGVAALTRDDASAFFAHRIMNLRKLFPYVPEDLNRVLMHFSFGTRRFYDSVEAVLADLRPAVAALEADSERETS